MLNWMGFSAPKPVVVALLALFPALAIAGFELVIDGGFEEPSVYGDHVSDAWRVHDTLTASVSSVTGRSGTAFAVAALADDSLCGIRTSFATEPGTEYTLKLWHRGGAGRAAMLEAGAGSFGKVVALGPDPSWTECSCNWTASSPGLAVFLFDDWGGSSSQFDDVSFSEPASGTTTFEPPINVLFLVHVEGSAGADYDAWMLENRWLKGLCAQRGFKLTYLSHGAYMEDVTFCGDRDSILEFIGLGHQVGTHNHGKVRLAPRLWRVADYTFWDTARISWGQNREWVDSVVGAQNNRAVCAAVHLPYEAALMDSFQYSQTVGPSASVPGTRGREQVGWDFVGHQPHHPYRPGASAVEGEQWLEDVTAGFVNVDNYAQVGLATALGFPCEVRDFKRFFRHLYQQWLSKESNPEPAGDDKVWTFGFLTHLGANTPAVRSKVDSVMTWLNDSFIGKPTPRGNVVARCATRQLVQDEFMLWAEQHPGAVSFSFKYPVLVAEGVEEQGDGARRPDAGAVISRRTLIARSRSLLCDATGRRVLALEPGANDAARLAPGVYYLLAAGEHQRRKVLLLP